LKAAYAPLEVVLKIKPRSNRDSRGWWGRERGAPASGCPRRVPLTLRFPGVKQELRPTCPAWQRPLRAGPPPPGRRMSSDRGSSRAPALFSFCSGERSRRPRNPAPPRGGASATGTGLSTLDPPPGIPKAARLPRSLAKPSSPISPRLRAPRPPAPAPCPGRAAPAPAPWSLPYLRSGRGGGSPRETLRRRLEPQGLFQGAGGNPSRRAPRGARERSPRRAAEHGGGPGAGGARRRICPARAPGGAAGGVRGVAPGGGGCARRGEGSGGARASSGGGEQGAGNQAVRPPLPSRWRRRRRGGACRRGAGREGGRRRGRQRAGRRRRGRGRRAAHWPAGPGAGGCAAARGLWSSWGEAASASPSSYTRLKWLGGRGEEGRVGEPTTLGTRGREAPKASPQRSERGGGRQGEGGSRSRAASRYIPPLCPLIHPSIHSFIRPSTYAFIHKQVPTVYSAGQGKSFLSAWRPFPTQTPHLQFPPCTP
jgi:hypothetical protein